MREYPKFFEALRSLTPLTPGQLDIALYLCQFQGWVPFVHVQYGNGAVISDQEQEQKKKWGRKHEELQRQEAAGEAAGAGRRAQDGPSTDGNASQPGSTDDWHQRKNMPTIGSDVGELLLLILS